MIGSPVRLDAAEKKDTIFERHRSVGGCGVKIERAVAFDVKNAVRRCIATGRVPIVSARLFQVRTRA